MRAASVAPPGVRPPSLGSRVLILAAAFAVKGIVLAELGEHPLLQPHGDLDTTHYVDLARRVADGGAFAIREPFFVSPLYVFFLAAVFRMGGALFAARIVQVILGTAAVGLLFETTRQWFGETCARVAAALAILTGLFTFYEILILPAALDPFLTACALFTISRAQIDVRARWLAGAGLSAGLLALNRPNALPYVAMAASGIALASMPRAAVRRAIGRAGIFVAGAMLVLAPNAIRNYGVSGEWILVSSHGGLNFYIGNNNQSDGTYTRLPGITPSIVGQTRDANRMAEAALGRRLSAGEVSRYFYGLGWEWIAANPSAAFRVFVRKMALLLNATNVPLNYSYAYYSRDESTLLRVLVVGPWLIVPLGVVGLFLPKMRQHDRGFWVWASFVPVYGLSVAAFFVSDRYRMPLLVPLCAASAATLTSFARAIRERRAALIVRLAVAVAALATLTNWNIGADDGRSTEQTRKAVWLVEEGAFDDASRYVEAVSPKHRYPGVLRFRVGDALAAAGRTDDAIARYRQALDIDRGQPAIRLALGEALVAKGAPGEAEPHLRAALAAGYQPDVAVTWLIRALALEGKQPAALALLADPGIDPSTATAAAASDLGTIALELNAVGSAERWLRAAVAQRPEDPDVHEKLGVARLMLGNAADALAPLERACALAPSRVGPRLNLAVAYAQLGRFDDARRNAEHAQRLDPHDARVADLLNKLGVR